jgi:pimeloyl-ACP methyl ester carboxylesterase
MPRIQVNGTTLHYEEYGSGDHVLISTQNFFFSGCHMELLGKPPYDYHVYLITMRGYGESEHVQDPLQRNWVPVWGEDVLAFAKQKGIDRFFYTGISHGCWAGWYIALHKPEVLRGFAAVNGIIQFTPPNAGKVYPPMQDVDWDRIVGNREALCKMAWNAAYPTKDERRLARREHCRTEHLAILMGRTKEELMLRNTSMSCCDAATEEELFRRLSGIPVPVLILNGIRDHLSTPQQALRVAAAIPGAKLVMFEDFEHASADECPEIVAAECDRFFKDSCRIDGALHR